VSSSHPAPSPARRRRPLPPLTPPPPRPPPPRAPPRAPHTLPPAPDSFGSAFFIVRNDISGNIERLRGRKASDPARFERLFPIVEDEVARNDDNHGSSCTKGLLWLKRCAGGVGGRRPRARGGRARASERCGRRRSRGAALLQASQPAAAAPRRQPLPPFPPPPRPARWSS
jgi:hypothetical protein